MERLKNFLENVFFGDRSKNFCEDLFFFFGEHLRLCPWSLALSIPVLGLESVCPRKGCPWPWPRIFFVSLALASSLASSTPPLIRMLTGSGYQEHTNPLFYRTKCLKLKDIYFLETAKPMYKIYNNLLSFANLDKFNLIKNRYTHKTRLSHKNNFCLPRTRTRLGQKSPSYAGIKIWNEIPSSLKEVSFYIFKKAVKAHFLSNYETDKS